MLTQFLLGATQVAEYQPQTGKYYYYTTDQINSTRIVTDDLGNMVYAAAHDPYGGVQQTWVNTFNPELKFSGKEQDTESGLYYFGARYYATTSDKFNDNFCEHNNVNCWAGHSFIQMIRRMGHMNSKFLSIFLVLTSLFFVLLLETELDGQTTSSSNWDKARAAFENFLIRPDNLTAWEFLNSIPLDDRAEVNKGRFIEYLGDNYDRYMIIILEMEAGNKYAVRAAIRLLPFLDGKLKDNLRMSLNELVRINPAIFLRACYEEKDSLFIKTNGYPVTQLSKLMKHNRSIGYYELKKRKEALESIEDLELKPIRDKCIKDIEKGMKELGIKGIAYSKKKLKISGNLIQDIKAAVNEIIACPCPENFKQLSDLLPEKASNDVRSLLEQLVFPETNSPDYEEKALLPLIGHEAICGNVGAVELLFVLDNYYYRMDIYNMFIEGAISALILRNPALFIEKLAKYQKRFRSEEKIIGICTEQIYCGYPNESIGVSILEKRVAALERLNIPQYKELIEQCIAILKDEIERYRKPFIMFNLPKK